MKSASTNNYLYSLYIVPNMDYCKNIVLRYLGTGELDETLSLVQVHLYQNIAYYNPQKPLMTWLHICIKRYVCSLNKTRHNELVTLVSIERNKVDKHIEVKPSNQYFKTGDFDKLGTLFFSDSLYKGLKNLTPLDRHLILMCYIDGYNCSDIAKKYNLDYKQTKSRLFIAREILRYYITGNKPKRTSLFSYLEKSTSLNRQCRHF